MAKKARFFKVRLRDGHGEDDVIFPAQSKASLLNNLEIPDTVKLISTIHMGWREVTAVPNDDMDGVDFKVNGKGRELTVSTGDLGHDYLTQQFPDQVKAVHDHLNEYHDPDF